MSRPNREQLARDVIDDRGLAASETRSTAGGYGDSSLSDEEQLPS
jgi:hypothetical protein